MDGNVAKAPVSVDEVHGAKKAVVVRLAMTLAPLVLEFFARGVRQIVLCERMVAIVFVVVWCVHKLTIARPNATANLLIHRCALTRVDGHGCCRGTPARRV